MGLLNKSRPVGHPRAMLLLAAFVFGPALAGVADDKSTIYFRAPDGTSDSDLAKACKSIVSRCKVYGYEGVKTKVEKNKNGRSYVRMDVESGITEEMQITLETMGRFAAKTFELRIYRTLTAGEKEQFKPPALDKIEGAKAPKGTKWHRRIAFHANVEGKVLDPVLLLDSPIVARNEILPPYKDRDDWTQYFYTFADAAAKKVTDAVGPGASFSAEFVVDGVVFFADNELNTVNRPNDGRIWYRHGFLERERKILEGYMKVAMPCPLNLVDTDVEEGFEVPADAKIGDGEER